MSVPEPIRSHAWYKVAAMAAAALILFGGGAALGVWFSQNYRIVPVDPAPTARGELPPPALPTVVPVAEATRRAAAAKPSVAYAVGDAKRYTLSATVSGEGQDMLFGPGTLGLQFDATMLQKTQDVLPSGAAELQLSFDEAALRGNFLGDTVEMLHRPEESTFNMGQNMQVRVRGRGANSGLTQLDFFREPLQMTVEPDGTVRSVRGPGTFGDLLGAVPLVGGQVLPKETPETGERWESRIMLPVPGLGQAVPARTLNERVGEATINGKRCAVVQQTITGFAEDGSFVAPPGVLGPEMQFAMPEFALDGQNQIYYDLETGELVQADLNLRLGVELGQEMKGLATLLNAYGGLLRELEGGQPADIDPPQAPAPGNLLDFAVRIVGTLKAEDSAS